MFEDENGVGYETHQELIFNGILNGCGCGNAEEIAEDVWNIFVGIAVHSETTWKLLCENKYEQFIAHMLDGADLLEHGGNICGSWLSEKGREFYISTMQIVKEIEPDETKYQLVKQPNFDRFSLVMDFDNKIHSFDCQKWGLKVSRAQVSDMVFKDTAEICRECKPWPVEEVTA